MVELGIARYKMLSQVDHDRLVIGAVDISTIANGRRQIVPITKVIEVIVDAENRCRAFLVRIE